MATEVAIVGAGISGLAAGRRLRQAGLRPVIFEAEDFVGGRMSSEEVGGFIVDRAAYTFPEFHRELRRCAEELGLAGALLPTPGTSSTFRAGKEHRIKIGSPSDFLRYKLLSGKAKRDMVRIFLYAVSLGRALDAKRPSALTFELESESAADYLLGQYGEELLECIAYPIFSEIFLGEPEGNSKLAFLSMVRHLTWFKIFGLEGGMGALPRRMAEGMDVRLGTPVHRIRNPGPSGPFELDVGGASPARREFDAVILAVPLPAAGRLFPDVGEALKAHFEFAEYAPSIVVALALDRRLPDGAMVNNLLRTEFPTLGTVIVDRHKGPGRVPEGKELLTAVLTEPGTRRLWEQPDDRVTEAVLGELERVFPGAGSGLLFSRVYRWEFGALQLPPGTLRRQIAARDALESALPRVAFAGDGLQKSSLEMGFRTGVAAAEKVLAGR